MNKQVSMPVLYSYEGGDVTEMDTKTLEEYLKRSLSLIELLEANVKAIDEERNRRTELAKWGLEAE